MDAVEETYEQLLASPVLDHDPWSRPNLQTFRPRHLALWRAVAAYLQGPRDTIADIGCNNGFFLRLAEELGFRRFIAVDYFPQPPDRSFLTGLEEVSFLRRNFNADGFLAGVEDGSADVVVSTEVLEHLYHHPAGYLAEVWRIVRPGGLLLLSTPNPGNIAKALRALRGKPAAWGDLAFARTPKLVDGEEPLAVWDIHFREYQPRDVMTLLSELPGAELMESGFLVNAPDVTTSRRGRIVKWLIWKTRLGHLRLLAATQYHVVRKRVEH